MQYRANYVGILILGSNSKEKGPIASIRAKKFGINIIHTFKQFTT